MAPGVSPGIKQKNNSQAREAGERNFNLNGFINIVGKSSVAPTGLTIVS
jgi:hypothetical protein